MRKIDSSQVKKLNSGACVPSLTVRSIFLEIDMYSSERELVNAFKYISKTFTRDLLGKKPTNFFVMEEFDSLNGVADIVLGTYKPYLSRKRIRTGINSNWISPLSTLNIGDRFESDAFMAKYDISKRTATKVLSEYVSAGFLRQTDSSFYIVVNSYQAITDTIVSIEAKMRNWQKALTQAKRYQRFSNLSFVLLDEKTSHSAIRNIDSFINQNIGLITMKDFDYKIHFMPNRKEQNKSQYFLRFNEFAYSAFKESILTV